ADGEVVALGEIEQGDGQYSACGWWLRRNGTTFVCAPKLPGPSRYHAAKGVLIESWDAALPSRGEPFGVAARTGRLLQIADGRWQELDSFRCLGRPFDDALNEAGSSGLATWQRETTRRLIATARIAKANLESDAAISRLEQALAVDGCNPEAWRLLG